MAKYNLLTYLLIYLLTYLLTYLLIWLFKVSYILSLIEKYTKIPQKKATELLVLA